MRIYISIPISGRNIEKQCAAASEIADNLRKLGHEPVNPFDTPEAPPDMSDKEKYAYYMGEDIKRLLMCDAVFLCERWNESKGCLLEFHATSIYGLEQYGRLEDIPKANGHE